MFEGCFKSKARALEQQRQAMWSKYHQLRMAFMGEKNCHTVVLAEGMGPTCSAKRNWSVHHPFTFLFLSICYWLMELVEEIKLNRKYAKIQQNLSWWTFYKSCSRHNGAWKDQLRKRALWRGLWRRESCQSPSMSRVGIIQHHPNLS